MEITINREHESGSGWAFDLEVIDRRGRRHVYTLRLSWADYNLWCPEGTERPESVAKAVMQFILAREPAEELADAFDAARIRRRHPDADEIIPTLIATR